MSNTDFNEESDPPKAGSLKDMALDAAQGVKREAASFATDAQDHLSDQMEDRRDDAVRGLHVFADAIRTAGDDLSSHDQSVAGQLVKRAADGLEGLSRSVSDKSPEALLGAVRQFGRDNPIAFAGAAVLLGVALGRVARSSAPDDLAADRAGGRADATAGSRVETPSPSGSASSVSPGNGAGFTGDDPGVALIAGGAGSSPAEGA